MDSINSIPPGSVVTCTYQYMPSSNRNVLLAIEDGRAMMQSLRGDEQHWSAPIGYVERVEPDTEECQRCKRRRMMRAYRQKKLAASVERGD